MHGEYSCEFLSLLSAVPEKAVMKTPESEVKKNKRKLDVTKEPPKKLSNIDGKMPTKFVNQHALSQLKKVRFGMCLTMT